MEKLADDYEYGERAAMRQLDGSFDEIEANQLALIDINQRRLPDADNQKEKQQAENRQREIHRGPDDELSQIQAKRDKVGELFRTETDVQEKAELQAEWLSLSRQIIELRKRKES